jgi:predicted dehydrogenase
MMKVAIMGMRHGHIYSLIQAVKAHDELELVAICEEDQETRSKLSSEIFDGPVFDSYQTMLEEVECDVIGIGDYYSKRGEVAITALQRGKHILSDKPLCTRLDELDEITRLAREKQGSVGCMLDLREAPPFRLLRDLVQSGELGAVHAISFGAQHPLMWGTRDSWYFEEGKHGGTISDIAVHALDFLPVLTGQEVTCIHAARNWNARLPQVPHFRDAAQLMISMADGCGVIGDVSYMMPDSFGYKNPHYWCFTVWGDKGMAQTSVAADLVTLYKDGETKLQEISVTVEKNQGYLAAFLAETAGEPRELTTDVVLRSTRVTLMAQQAADLGQTNVSVVS